MSIDCQCNGQRARQTLKGKLYKGRRDRSLCTHEPTQNRSDARRSRKMNVLIFVTFP